jgi:2'-5' RNA ligase
MRLFAALPVVGEARLELERRLAGYRREEWPVKWVGDNGLHVTTKFLGEVGAGQVDAVRSVLREASTGTPPLPLLPTELGAFPNFIRARVLWAGYESEAALELMVHRIEQATGGLGFPLEGRPFRPHVTLGRLNEGATLPAEGAERLQHDKLSAGFIADRLVLYQSRSGTAGSTYSEVDSFPLGS